jgi:acyl carrier protein
MEFEMVRQIISAVFEIPADEITTETSFVDGFSMDSLDIAQLVSEIEDVFKIEFNEAHILKILTVGDAVEYIKKIL